VTGWLCGDARDFVYYASRTAYEREERDRMAAAAVERLADIIANRERSLESWERVLEEEKCSTHTRAKLKAI
jgi:hypothetical protein